LYEGLVHSRFWPPLGFPLLAHLLGMLAMAALTRALWSAGEVAMTWAGIAWGSMPNLLIPFAFGHDAQFGSASLMPVVLLLVHRLFAADRAHGAAGAALLLALALGVQTLTGHPQIVAYGVMLAAAFALERAWRFRRPRRLLAAGLAAAAAAAVS